MTLPTRAVGPFTVSAVGLGCMNLSHAYRPLPPATEAERLLNHALDLGVTFLDTAALYGEGANEALVGRAVGHRRGEYVLASKCVLGMDDGRRVLDGSAAAITRMLDAALVRLGTDHIDLYYLHRLDPEVPIEESVDALARARAAGKIGAIGLSEMGAATLRRAHAVHPIAAMQSEYSPIVRNPEIAVADACRELGVTLVAFSPVARGMLAGAIRDDGYPAGDIRATMPRFTGERLRRNLALVDRFDALARAAGMMPAQLAIGWTLARGAVPIPGTTSIAHLEENVAATSMTVDPHTLAAVDAIFAEGLAGPRYNAAAQAQIDTETFADEELEKAER